MTKQTSSQTTKFAPFSSEKGSVLLTTMIIGIVVSIMLFASMTYIKSRADVMFKASNRLDFRIVLDGINAYTVNGIKQSWCFSTDWSQDTGTCNLNNPRNTVRLLLNDETLTYIGATTVPRPANLYDTRLKSMTATINLDSITSSHPLFNITRPVAKAYSTAAITIKREDSSIATTKGREVPLSLYIVLTPDVESEAFPKLELKSQVIVYPRELTYFALILPRNLYLNTSDPDPASGDSAFAAVAGTSTGLRFESPIFVNGSLHLPGKATNKMSNVTFVDKVFIGGGMIYQDGKLFNPIDAGGAQSSMNSVLPSFPGVLGGFELDRQKDEGLDYLFQLNSETPPALADAEICRKRIAAAYDLTVTKDSQLYAKYRGKSGNSFAVSLNLGMIDNFVEQTGDGSGNSLYGVATSVPGVSKAGAVSTTWNGGAILKARMIYEGMADPSTPGTRKTFVNEFYIPRNGEITLFPNGPGYSDIKITAKPLLVGGNQQHNQVDLTVSFNNASSLDVADYKPAGSTTVSPGSVKLLVEAMDYAYNATDNIRNGASINPAIGAFKTNGFVFLKNGGTMDMAAPDTAWHLTPTLVNNTTIETISASEKPQDGIDFATFDKACMAVPGSDAAFYASFPAADWSTSFVKQSRAAWSFSPEFTDGPAPGGYLNGNLIFDAGSNTEFKIRSLAKNCIITAAATMVTGFYTCESLVIQSRSTPLRIIGTFIAKNVQVAASAYQAGIRWSTIYHPQSVYELRAAGLLGKRADGTTVNCDSPTMPPLWMANIGLSTAVDHYLCNPVSLRKADPFKWTTVDPDCGVVDGAPIRSCKKAMMRFLIKEISRSKGL